jgi:hypothetical protein
MSVARTAAMFAVVGDVTLRFLVGVKVPVMGRLNQDRTMSR